MKLRRGTKSGSGITPRTRLLLVTLVFLAVFGALSVFDYFWPLPDGGRTFTSTRPTIAEENSKRALIVDGLSIEFPNPEFLREATLALRMMGYDVDIVGPEGVTVDFYRELPSMGYEIIILRIHSAPIEGGGVSLFTTEPCDPRRYVAEKLRGWVGNGVTLGSNKCFIAVTPLLILEGAKGNFSNATVIFMGCSAARDHETASAFLLRGASAFVGWDDYVQPEYSDAVISRLLKLIARGMDIKESVRAVMGEMGPDPAFSAKLKIFVRSRD